MISVIIPVHNRAHTISLCLQGLALQTAQDSFEVIIVDDRSTDDTLKVVTAFMRTTSLKIKVCSVYKKEAWNASRPRNFGAKMAEQGTTHYLFLDSDVVLNPKAIEYYIEDIQVNPDRVVIGPYHWTAPMMVLPSDIEHHFDDFINNRLAPRYVNGPLGIVGQDIRMISFNEKGADPTKTTSEVFDGLSCFGGNLLVPRNLFWKSGGYDEQTLCGIEDGDFGITLWKHEAQFSYDTRAVGYHAWHPIPPGRHPADFKKNHLDRLNMKHFNTLDPDFGIIAHSRELYKRWGFPGWNPPPEWEK